MYSSKFNIYDNKFTFQVDSKRLHIYLAIQQGLSPEGIISSFFSYSYSKIFPLEADINAFDQIKEKNIKSTSRSGTCFAISSDGFLVTNYHLVENSNTINIKGIKGDFQKTYSAEIIVFDKNNDLAIIKIYDNDFISLGTIPYKIKNGLANVGENIFVLGYPLRATMGDEIKLTNGIISSKTGFQGDITSYQVSAPVQPGNSGAPMFDVNGYLIGIINAKHIGAENATYAIKISYLNNLVELIPNPLHSPAVNILVSKTLSEQVLLINKFVYIIEVN